MSQAAADLSTQETMARINNLQADTIKKLAEAKVVGWQVAFGGFTAGAAIIAAVVALMKVLGG